MPTCVELQYSVTFGKGDSSDWIEWEVDLIGKEEEAYLRAKMLRLSLNDVPELRGVLAAAYEEIEKGEIENLIEGEDEYVMECTGRLPVDPDEINELVADRDRHTLEFFGLTDLADEELDEWDANDLDELPEVCDFREDFEPISPFDEGYSLNVEFAECPDEEDVEEDEARETLKTLFREANGNFSVINDYVERCEDLFYGDGTLKELADKVAGEMGIEF